MAGLKNFVHAVLLLSLAVLAASGAIGAAKHFIFN